jgi:hypothetical protein
MALPPPPKYKRIIEEHDAKHVQAEKSKRERLKALAIKRLKDWEAEQERERRRRSSAPVARHPYDNGFTNGSNGPFTVTITDASGVVIYQS